MLAISRTRRFECLAVQLGIVLASVFVLSGCAGYQFGNRSLYPTHIETVYVPMIDSGSFRRDFGERLTEAVIKEIELKTDYTVVNSPNNADSVLNAYVVSDGKRVVAENRYDDPRQVQIDLRVQVDWIDRRGQMIRSSDTVCLPPAATMVAGSADLVAEVGQSVVTTQQQAICRTAEQIVAMMEAPW